jgi:hypothetical protein
MQFTTRALQDKLEWLVHARLYVVMTSYFVEAVNYSNVFLLHWPLWLVL